MCAAGGAGRGRGVARQRQRGRRAAARPREARLGWAPRANPASRPPERGAAAPRASRGSPASPAQARAAAGGPAPRARCPTLGTAACASWEAVWVAERSRLTCPAASHCCWPSRTTKLRWAGDRNAVLAPRVAVPTPKPCRPPMRAPARSARPEAAPLARSLLQAGSSGLARLPGCLHTCREACRCQAGGRTLAQGGCRRRFTSPSRASPASSIPPRAPFIPSEH